MLKCEYSLEVDVTIPSWASWNWPLSAQVQMILTCQCLLSTSFLKWRKRNVSQSHPKATWWVAYCRVTGCPPKLCGFIFSQLFFESGIWVARLGSLQSRYWLGLQATRLEWGRVCFQDHSLGCWEDSVPHGCWIEGLSSSWAGERPTGFLAKWTLHHSMVPGFTRVSYRGDRRAYEQARSQSL